MKYISVNKISDFNFHDAKFVLACFLGNEIVIEATQLNILKTSKLNRAKKDMELDNAYIKLKNLSNVTFETNEDPLNPDSEKVVVYDSEAVFQFIMQLDCTANVLNFGKNDDDTYYIEAIAESRFFTVCFKSDKIVIVWSKFKKEAWYENKS